MRVLVVEDETPLANLVADGLRTAGMAVDIAADGMSALAKSEVNDYDVVILDRGLPDISGDDVCRRISGRSAAVLMLTARGAEQDEVDGFALGADDYLAKPFSFPVLTARVRALARRNVDEATPVLERGGIRLIGPPSRPGGTGACWL
jgi:DNA-binding response OmpR family regulator